MQKLVMYVLIGLCLSATIAFATQIHSDQANILYYVISKQAKLYRDSARSDPYLRLRFREPVTLLSTEGDLVQKVRTMDGAVGYVDRDNISNIWIYVSKRRRQLSLYQGVEIISEFNADFGYNGFSDKVLRGSEASPDHWRTPEGVFYVVKKNPYSQFYRALLLNYPNTEDAERGLKDGIINRQEYEAILRADHRGTPPPMATNLGGLIEIHGNGTGLASNWTEGCVAVRDEDMDFMWPYVQEGTPVVIEK